MHWWSQRVSAVCVVNNPQLMDTTRSISLDTNGSHFCFNICCLSLNASWTVVLSCFTCRLVQLPTSRDGKSRSTPDKTRETRLARSRTRTGPSGSGRGSWGPLQVSPGRPSSSGRRRGSRRSRRWKGRRSRPPTGPGATRSTDTRGTPAAGENTSHQV